MEIEILNSNNEKIGNKKMPVQFNEAIRPDVIKRAVFVIQNNRRQPRGASPEAGKRASAKVSRRRRDYRGSYGLGISRVPRKIMSRSGTRMNWVGAFAPGTVGGREAHPPKATKILKRKINTKERKLAIRSAISATVIKDLVKARGHNVPDGYPFIIDSKFEGMQKTSDVILAFEKLGLALEIERGREKKVRSGHGKLRGRKYTKKKGPLVVTSNVCSLMKAVRNIPGFDIVPVDRLNAEDLAPGTSIGRLTLWTAAAVDRIEKEKLFSR